MHRHSGKVRALGLCSGGLDSILSALVLRRQDIEVAWITFETPFFSAEKAELAAAGNNIPIMVRNITPVYLEMLAHPPAGYGKHMNPCMDCHALMFRLAGDIMAAEGYDFLFSGEVTGQRPMSQNKASLRYVEKRSGYDGHILRPLSARQLPVTKPEARVWWTGTGFSIFRDGPESPRWPWPGSWGSPTTPPQPAAASSPTRGIQDGSVTSWITAGR